MSHPPRILGSCLLALVLATQVPAQAPPPAGDNRLSRNFQGTAFRDAVASLFAGRADTALVLPEVALNPVDLKLEGVSWASALDQLLRQGKAEYRKEGGVYVFYSPRAVEGAVLAEVLREGEAIQVRLERYPLRRLPDLLNRHLGNRPLAPVPPALAARAVTVMVGPVKPLEALRQIAEAAEAFVEDRPPAPLALAPPVPVVRVEPLSQNGLEIHFRQAPLREAYAALISMGLPLVVRPEIPDIPISMQIRTDRETALKLLNLYARHWIPRLETRAETSGLQVYLRSTTSGGENGPKISADLRDVPLRQAVRLMLQGTGAQYAIEPNVPEVPVTIFLEDVEIPQALRLLVRVAAAAYPGITVRRDENVWVVGMRRAGTE
jgi:hypothetical protein